MWLGVRGLRKTKQELLMQLIPLSPRPYNRTHLVLFPSFQDLVYIFKLDPKESTDIKTLFQAQSVCKVSLKSIPKPGIYLPCICHLQI